MAKINVKPLGDRVLLELCDVAEQVKGGIIIPDTAKEKPQEFRVVALGTGKSLESLNQMQDGTMNLSRRKQMN